jgi:hypothetical protein
MADDLVMIIFNKCIDTTLDDSSDDDDKIFSRGCLFSMTISNLPYHRPRIYPKHETMDRDEIAPHV